MKVLAKIGELQIWNYSFYAIVCGTGVWLITKGIEGFKSLD